MGSPQNIDPRAQNDPRNRYPTDEQFYANDRTDPSALPEDRPRGGSTGDPFKHPRTWGTVAVIVFVILIVILGIALFP